MVIKEIPNDYSIVDGKNTIIINKKRFTIYADRFPGKYIHLYFDYYYNPYVFCFMLHEIYNGIKNYSIYIRNNNSSALYIKGYAIIRNLISKSKNIYKCDKRLYDDNLLTIIIDDYIIELYVDHKSIILDEDYNIYNPLIEIYLIKALEPLLFDNHTIPCKVIDRKHARRIVEIYG